MYFLRAECEKYCLNLYLKKKYSALWDSSSGRCIICALCSEVRELETCNDVGVNVIIYQVENGDIFDFYKPGHYDDRSLAMIVMEINP